MSSHAHLQISKHSLIQQSFPDIPDQDTEVVSQSPPPPLDPLKGVCECDNDPKDALKFLKVSLSRMVDYNHDCTV